MVHTARLLPVKLGPAQTLGVKHLMAHERAALFAGLGIGKTVTTLAAFEGLRLLGDAQSALIVAPIRVCNLTWPNEVRKWAEFRHLRVANLRTKDGWRAFLNSESDLYVCNYEMLPKIAEAIDVYGCPFDLVVFDELTRAKNPKSTRVNALREKLPPHVRRWGLTGTPTPNGYLDLFSQIRLLDEGQRLGRSYDAYKRAYFHSVDYMEYDWRLNDGADKVIQAKISDIALTLLSEDYGMKVPINEVDVEVALPDEAKEQYRTLEKELLLSLGDEEEPVVAASAGVLVNKLLQVCGGAVYNDAKKTIRIHDAKLKATREYLKEHLNEPVMIVYNYRHELERLKEIIRDPVAFEDYKTPEAQSGLERAWNEKRIRRLLVHPQSVGHGLNLQMGGAHILWFSPTWSRENYDQLNARLARQGQKAPVVEVARVLCPGTMDDAVVETLREKDTGQRALLNALKNFRLLKQ